MRIFINRILAFGTMAIMLLAVSSAYGQSSPSITIKGENITILEALSKVEQQSSYTVAYENTKLNEEKRISIDVANVALPVALDAILKTSNAQYRISGTHIFITPKTIASGTRTVASATTATQTSKPSTDVRSGTTTSVQTTAPKLVNTTASVATSSSTPTATTASTTQTALANSVTIAVSTTQVTAVTESAAQPAGATTVQDSATAPDASTSEPVQVEYIVRDSVYLRSINFRFDSSVIDPSYMNNAESLKMIDKMLTDPSVMSNIRSVVLTTMSSPDGDPAYNSRLAKRRSEQFRQYIVSKYPNIDASKIVMVPAYENWQGLKAMVTIDTKVPGRETLLNMIDDSSLTDNQKSQRLLTIEGGKTFEYLRVNMLRYLRTGVAEVLFDYHEPEPTPESPVVDTIPSVKEPEVVVIDVPVEIPTTTVVYKKKYVAALRTNLLLDLAGTPNIGVEVPLGEHFSVAADFAYAYWHSNNLYAVQTIQGGLEGRYWFNPDGKLLSGWNAGIYGTYSSRYDVQWKGGYQGDGYWSAGLTGGYSLPVSNSLRLDFLLGAGYWYTPEVRKYSEPQDGHLIWEETRYDVSRFTITKVRVGLIWLFGKKIKVAQ